MEKNKWGEQVKGGGLIVPSSGFPDIGKLPCMRDGKWIAQVKRQVREGGRPWLWWQQSSFGAMCPWSRPVPNHSLSCQAILMTTGNEKHGHTYPPCSFA